jgi:MscS family membrane protein
MRLEIQLTRNFFHRAAMFFCLAVVGLLFATPPDMRAQTPPAASPPAAPRLNDPLNRDSPQSAVVSFLDACRTKNFARAGHYLDLRNIPSSDSRFQDRPQLAQQLGDILDRDVSFDVASLSRDQSGDLEDGLPPSRERVDSFTLNGKKLDLLLEHVNLRNGLSVWLFSSDSVKLIPQLSAMVTDSPVEKYLPEALVRPKFIGTPIWRCIALILLVLALTAISRSLSRLALAITAAVMKRVAPQIPSSVLQVFIGPLRLLLVVALFRAGVEWIGPSALLRLALSRILGLLFLSGIAWLFIGIVDLAMERLRVVLSSGRYQSVTSSALPLIGRVIKITILLLTVAAVLSQWGYNTTTILAGLGVGGVAVALASQKTIENLFGSVAVISDRPVSVGDFCRFDDRVGTVEDIGLRSTRIRTLDRTIVTIPNAQFSSMSLENFSKRDKMWFHQILNLRRDTTPDQVRTLLASITKILQDDPHTEVGPLPVRFIGVGSYSLDLETFAYVLTPNFDTFLKKQQELLLKILDAIEDAGTALALPTQANIWYASGNGNTPEGAIATPPRPPVRG